MMIKETEKEHYEVTEFNSRRLQRGEKHCFRADVFQNGNLVDWVWLSVSDISEILKDERCSILGHEKFNKEVLKAKTWERLWNE